MDDEDQMAAEAHQYELECRRWCEDQLITRLRKETSGFRDECNSFSATFRQADRALRKSNASCK